MALRVQLIGGPLDGQDAAHRALPFIWVGVTGPKQVRVYENPGGSRLLYRKCGDVYLYAGHTHRRCRGCEAIHQAAESKACSLCGGRLAAA